MSNKQIGSLRWGLDSKRKHAEGEISAERRIEAATGTAQPVSTYSTQICDDLGEFTPETTG